MNILHLSANAEQSIKEAVTLFQKLEMKSEMKVLASKELTKKAVKSKLMETQGKHIRMLSSKLYNTYKRKLFMPVKRIVW